MEEITMFETIFVNVMTAILIAGVTWLITKVGKWINTFIDDRNKLFLHLTC